jgi:hypothetical protein
MTDDKEEGIDLHSPGCAIYENKECDCIVSKKKKRLSDEEKEKGK